jgi:DNA polymerase-3 subunit delta'
VTAAFDGLPEQPEARRLLEAALADPGHAYLLAGPPGSAKRRYAEHFAAALLHSRLERITGGTHPDLFRLEPEGTGILIDQARALRRDLHMRPFEAERRVYLVLDAHLLRDESANALLKSLEEPPAYGVFVLVSDSAERLLPTIISRVQRVGFRRFTTAELASVTGDPVAARAAIGDLGRAEQLAGDEDAAARRRSYLQLARGALTDPGFDPTAAAAEVTAAAGRAGKAAGQALTASQQALLATIDDPKERRAIEKRTEERAKRAARRAELDELREALDTVAWWYRDVLAARLGAEGVVVHSDMAGEASEDARNGAPGELAQALAIVAEARQSFDFNVSPALAVEALFHRLRRVPVAQP